MESNNNNNNHKMNPEVIVHELSRNQYKRVPENLPAIATYLDNAASSIDNDAKGAANNFRTVFVAVYMILYNILRTNKKEFRRCSSTERTTLLDLTNRFQYCKSPTVRGAVALFCLPKTIRRVDRFKIVASFLSNSMPNNESVRDICSDVSTVSQKFKDVEIKWASPDITNEQSMNEFVRFSRVMLQLSDYTNDKSLAQFAKSVNKYAYYININYFMRKLKSFNMTMFEPMIAAYIKHCVAPIDAQKEYNRLNQQFQVNPHDVVQFIQDQLPETEMFSQPREKRAASTTSNGHKSPNEKIDPKRDSRPVATISKNLIQHYRPDRIYDVYIGHSNYQQYLELTNVATAQSIYHVAMVHHCLYDVFETRDILVKDPKNKSVMDLPWHKRLSLVDWRARVALKSMTGEELVNYKNLTNKSQAVTISCINDDGLSTTQTIIVKPYDTKPKISKKRVNASNESSEQQENGTLKRLKIEETDV